MKSSVVMELASENGRYSCVIILVRAEKRLKKILSYIRGDLYSLFGRNKT